jgi:hypothetical protein
MPVIYVYYNSLFKDLQPLSLNLFHRNFHAFCKRWKTLYIVQTGSGAHPASYPKGTGALSPGVRRPGREADQSPPASAEVKKTWVYISTPPYVFMT